MRNDAQDTAIRVLLGLAAHERQDGRVYAAEASRGNVGREACRGRDGR